MSHRFFIPLTGMLVLAASLGQRAHAESPPTGWQSLRDYFGQCEISVPADWQLTRGPRAGADKSGTKYHIALAPAIPKVKRPYLEQRDSMKRQWSMNGSFTIVEETGSRAIYRFPNAGRYQWEVITAGAPNCMAALNSDKSDDPLILQIARTLHHVD